MCLAKHTAVQIDDEDHELNGLSGVVYKTRGETDSLGDRTPRGWCEVIFDPMDTAGYHRELFREADVSVCGC